MLETVTALVQPWADYYSASAWLPTLVIAVHVLSMFVGGGIALGADRRVLLATPGSSEAFLAMAEDLRATHGVVIGALVLMVCSGAALATADIGTFATSLVFWSKMGSFVVLMVNGARMRSAEHHLLTNARNTIEMSVAGPEVTGPWGTLRVHAWVSLAVWCLVVVLGVVVANI
ncbi:hypothetical protein [Gemmatimonas sp.]|uniref:hypothetical protein n=1 Tax=Gemmatimonas sp. TaxID=1962908 RepID=UPI003341712E